MKLTSSRLWALFACAVTTVTGQNSSSVCPGYAAKNVVTTASTLTADLQLAGPACNVYGYDLGALKLVVEYQTDTRLHIQIYDPAQQVYQVPSSVVARPDSTTSSSAADAALKFSIVKEPFSFSIQRTASNETIFDTSDVPLIFESQYLRLRTALPPSPNLYGLGEDTDPFRLPTDNYIRTLWSRDAYEIPAGTNLYGNHPVYFEHRTTNDETHGVFLLNSNGMDIMINTDDIGQYLEYNTLGGIIDLYVLAGPSPVQVAQQYSDVIGQPVMMPYWSLGFHQCRYGMQDIYEVADVVFNYSAADIPLETMWTDIDYMDLRKVFTLDPDRFPLEKVQELVTHLHDNDQHYIMMVDPAVAYQDYPPFNNGVDVGAFMVSNGSVFQGVVWPGITAFPDWFNPNTQGYWNGEFSTFFDPNTGVDIDGLWIDMNEASNFCPYPCSDPAAFAVSNGDPPAPPPVRATNPQSIPGWPADFQPSGYSKRFKRQTTNATGTMLGLPNRDLINPPYQIHDAAGSISDLTLATDLIHSNGLAEYDTHNLYGTMMSSTSRDAMINRRPGLRPLVITRSTFAGAGAKVGHWLGDNTATWEEYQISIAEAISFAAIYQVPMVGADVCGYAEETTINLCARWATLGAFLPFYRNHGAIGFTPHEFYRWPLVAQAARNAIKARYQLLDYIYTAMYQQTVDGTPLLNPMFFIYPEDSTTLFIQTQYFYGSSLLVSPVFVEDATDVTLYLPNDQYYDFFTYEPIRGTGAYMTLNSVDFTQIPVFIKGGSVIPIRVDGANTTAALRLLDFSLLVAPGLDGKASGSLYLDDGVSISQGATSNIMFAYDGSTLSMTGSFGYNVGDVYIKTIVLMGVTTGSNGTYGSTYNATAQTLTFQADKALTGGFTMHLA